jgi:D-cysteine desulfhydrase
VVERGRPSGANAVETRCVESKGFPLFDRFPGLATLPRVVLGRFPSPVERIVLDDGRGLWLKRDDCNALVAAGNKVRALEFLLGSVQPGDVVLTAGGEGSTHVYATAVHAERLGAATDAYRWQQVMHPMADAVAREARRRCATVVPTRWPAGALVRVAGWRMKASLTRAASHYVPIGGASALGVLGHVNAGLELAAQIAAHELPEPTHVVVPLGSGGTAAGLALGLGTGGVATTVVAARVAPLLVANAWRVQWLIERTRRLIRARCGASTLLPAAPVVVDHTVYGGAYGRPLTAGVEAAARIQHAIAERSGAPVTLDATYAAKAAAAALALGARGAGAERPGAWGRGADPCVLLWVTFDGRVMGIRNGRPERGPSFDE